MPTDTDQHVQALFDLAQDMLRVAHLADGQVMLLNPAWEAITGHRTNMLLATPFIEYVHPEDKETFRENFHGLRHGRPVVGYAARFRCADRIYRWLRWNATPADGFAYSIARDVTV
jgi:PAS domain S-box-containing protein